MKSAPSTPGIKVERKIDEVWTDANHQLIHPNHSLCTPPLEQISAAVLYIWHGVSQSFERLK
jgi:hypothetical protein